MMVIDYRGFRLLATSLLPVSKSTIVHGSFNAGTTVHFDPAVHKILWPVLQSLNLRPHRISVKSAAPDGSDTFVEMCGPIDLEVHRSTIDGEYVIVYLHLNRVLYEPNTLWPL